MSTQSDDFPSPRVPAWTLGWRLQRALAEAEMTSNQMAAEMGMARCEAIRG